jgi:hypothetical protein
VAVSLILSWYVGNIGILVCFDWLSSHIICQALCGENWRVGSYVRLSEREVWRGASLEIHL